MLVEVEDIVYKILRKKESIIASDYNDTNDELTQCENLLDSIYLKDMRERILLALSQLPLQQSNRIYLVYYLGFSKTEIAHIEGCTEGAIRKSIKRGLLQLKRILRKNF
ncbi:MAG TPA: sigma factor-like helix-turn-helix DNA-binding protein [Thomasclavelia ramosa]|nr:sigma factor-like helix-turn-helix DNA-binding protein [Thomasclavelia ramosa]